MKKNCIIFDDQLFGLKRIETSFAKNGIPASFFCVGLADGALKIVRELHNRGEQLDLLTADFRATRDKQGPTILENLIDQIIAKFGADMAPHKIFLHSAKSNLTVHTKFGRIPIFDDSEFLSLRDWDNYDTNPLTTILREYLNQSWGTRFILSQAEEFRRQNPNGKLTPFQAQILLDDKNSKPDDILSRIDLRDKSAFIDSPHVEQPEDRTGQPAALYFQRGAYGATIGKLAYSEDDIAAIRATESESEIILALRNAAGHEAPPARIAGLVVLEDDEHAAHIAQVCDNTGVPAAIGAERWNAWQLNTAGELAITNCETEASSGFLPAGSPVTLVGDRSSGALYAAALPLVSDNKVSPSYSSCLQLADQLLRKANISIKATADNAEQVSEAGAYDAHGVGLVRTEHNFRSAQDKAVVRACLLNGAPGAALLADFRQIQQAEMAGILERADNCGESFPVTFRLLDAPPAEFMGKTDVEAFATRVGRDNMRGVQAGLRTTGLYDTQIAALVDAFAKTQFRQEITLLVPNVNDQAEMDEVSAIFKRHAGSSPIILAPMVESRRYAEYLAQADVMPAPMVSYGTRDLTADFMGGIFNYDSPGILAWTRAQAEAGNDIGTNRPFLSLMTPVKNALLAIQRRPDAPGGTICGPQVAGDYDSIRWAVQHGLSISVPPRYAPYAKLVAGQELLNRTKLAP